MSKNRRQIYASMTMAHLYIEKASLYSGMSFLIGLLRNHPKISMFLKRELWIWEF